MRRWEILETRTVRQRRTAAGDKLVNNYRVLGALGRGRFAKVKLCERLTAPAAAVLGDGHGGLDGPPAGLPPTFAAPPPAAAPPRQFAMKIFSKKALVRMKEYVSQPAPRLCGGEEQGGDAPDAAAAGASRMRVVTALDRVRDEIAIMRTLFHRNVVLLFEVMESDDCDKIYLILELMEGGPCMNFQPDTKRFASAATRGPLTEKLAKAYTKDILDGLEYLHGRRICHRDIKPDNILLNSAGRCQLTDFGCAMVLPESGESELVSDTVGTFQFLAPECCSGELYDPFKVDAWAVGVVLFIFLTGALPFPADNTKELFEQIAAAPTELPLHVRQEVRPECVNLLLRLLARDPTERIGVQEALAHPWLNESQDDGYEGEPIFF